MKRLPVYILFCLSFIAVLCACNRTPDGVIPPARLARVGAGRRVGDGVVKGRQPGDVSPGRKLAVRNAVFERHGVTAEQYDSSLVWYGHNIKRYQDVTDRSIEILEERLVEANAASAADLAVSVAGDSVDLWLDVLPLIFTHSSPSHIYTFSSDSDANWIPGDRYTLRARILTPAEAVRWNMTAWYADGALETVSGVLSMSDVHRQELRLLTDSTRQAVRISGYIIVEPDGHKPAILDSLSLTRRHPVAGIRDSRPYQQRLYVPRSSDTITPR